ncbi:MAG: hypothetical protein NT062_11840 [Proteobacteria bacterium]|nr:hypothetical protein [Pseudomonadota bacterium]
MIELDAFLTAYDPSDLPGASVDPMGFERGYLYLADKILPGLTNVASVPRYFSMLCAGTSLANVASTASVRQQREVRRDAAMRLERLWALANYLAARKTSASVSGLRGVRYVAAEAQRLDTADASDANPDYQLLARQAPYGVLGIYGSVSEELKLFSDREIMELSPDAGLRLADAFCDETEMPAKVKKVVRGEGTVSLAILAKWGETAYLKGPHGPTEAACLGEALMRDPVRARMCALLAKRPFMDHELQNARLAAIAEGIDAQGPDADLREAITVILAYETAYTWSVLGFERLLFMCRGATTAVSASARANDPILQRVADALPGVVADLERSLTQVSTSHVGANPEQLVDVREFLKRTAESATDVLATSEAFVDRHADIQRGKFDRGRRKLPWLERGTEGLCLTMTRVGGAAGEITSPDEVRPHAYRFDAADAMLAAGGVA